MKLPQIFLRYLKGSTKKCLCFGGLELVLEGYANVDMAGDLDNRKSTFGLLFTFVRATMS